MLNSHINFQCIFHIIVFQQKCRRRHIRWQLWYAYFLYCVHRTFKHLSFCALILKTKNGYMERQRSVQVTTFVIYLEWFHNPLVMLWKWQSVLLLTCNIKISTWYSWTETTYALSSWRVLTLSILYTHLGSGL